ncbi:TPA: hypothetical protein ACKPZV_000223 [Stenotrophomonas maltophilia]
MIVAQASFQAIRGTDTLCQFWIRDEQGRVAADAMSITVEAVAYGRRHVREEWVGTGDDQGRVQFTVPGATKLDGGLYQLRVKVPVAGDAPPALLDGSESAPEEIAHLGLLEIV